jgi:hypothetical protein
MLAKNLHPGRLSAIAVASMALVLAAVAITRLCTSSGEIVRDATVRSINGDSQTGPTLVGAVALDGSAMSRNDRGGKAAVPPHCEGVVTGRIVAQSTSEPIQRAELTLSNGSASFSSSSGADGRFWFETAKPGEYRLIRLSANGYRFYSWPYQSAAVRFAVSPTSCLDVGEIVLRAAPNCTGHVEFENGKPARGVLIEIVDETGAVNRDAGGTSVRTGMNGEFDVACAATDHLRASMPGYMSTVTPVGSDDSITLVLRAAGALALSGRVLDEADRGAANVWVRATLLGTESTIGENTDVDGKFSLEKVPIGRYGLQVWRDGEALSPVLLADAGASDVVLRVQPTGWLEVSAVAEGSLEPIRTFEAGLVSVDRSGGDQVMSRGPRVLGLGGSARLRARTGQHSLWVRASGFEGPAVQQVIVSSQTGTPILMKLRPGETTSGTVFDAKTGAPIAGARVVATNFHPEEPINVANVVATDQRGDFTISGVTRTTDLRVLALGYRTWSHRGRAGSGAVLRIALDHEQAADSGAEFAYGGLAIHVGGQDGITVDEVEAGSSAERAGVQEGDRILAIDDIRADHINSIADALRGEPGTTVVLRLQRSDGGATYAAVQRERLQHTPGVP